MFRRFGHATHLVRMASLFLVGFAAFLVARWMLVPADFGKFGFYRAGTLDDVKAHPIAYAGTASCVECHAGKYMSEAADAPATVPDPVKDNRHSVLRCEACHGPLAYHALDQLKTVKDGHERAVAEVASDKLCLGCHLRVTGRPKHQPQILVGEHGENDKCVSCHRPHRPRTDEDEGGE